MSPNFDPDTANLRRQEIGEAQERVDAYAASTARFGSPAEQAADRKWHIDALRAEGFVIDEPGCIEDEAATFALEFDMWLAETGQDRLTEAQVDELARLQPAAGRSVPHEL